MPKGSNSNCGLATLEDSIALSTRSFFLGIRKFSLLPPNSSNSTDTLLIS